MKYCKWNHTRLHVCWMMICIKERYFKYHRIALIIAGLWPYQQSKLQFQLVLFLGILTSFITFQVFLYFYNHVMWLFTIYNIADENNILVPWIHSTFLLQFSRFLFVEYTFDFTIKMLSVVIYCIFFLINYLSFWVNMETVSWCYILCKNV